MPIGELRRGYHALMGTSSEVTSPARPCFRATLLGKLLKQWSCAHRLHIQCFKAIVIFFVALSICYSTLALGVQRQLNSSNSAVGGSGTWGAWGMIARQICRYSAHSYASSCLEEDEGQPTLALSGKHALSC